MLLKEALNEVVFKPPRPSYGAASFRGRLSLCWLPWGKVEPPAPATPAGACCRSAFACAALATGGHSAAPQACCGAGALPPPPLPCLWLGAERSSKVIIYFHANGDDLGCVNDFVLDLNKEFDVSVLAPEYPGYGLLSRLRPCEEGCVIAAEVALRFLLEEVGVDPADVILLGRSLGCGPALHLASKFHVGGVILLSAFTSIRDVAQHYVGSHLARAAFGDLFANRTLVTQISCPALFVHGVADRTVPMLHSARLFDLCRTRKLLVTPSKLTHNSDPFARHPDFAEPAMRFFGLPCRTGSAPRLPLAAFMLPEPAVEAPAVGLPCLARRAYASSSTGCLRAGREPPPCDEPAQQSAGCLSCKQLACGSGRESHPRPGADEVVPDDWQDGNPLASASSVGIGDPFCGTWARHSAGELRNPLGDERVAEPEHWRASV